MKPDQWTVGVHAVSTDVPDRTSDRHPDLEALPDVRPDDRPDDRPEQEVNSEKKECEDSSPSPDSSVEESRGIDGGWEGWTTCICAHLVLSTTWGVINSFGTFQTYYADFLAPLPPSTISWIGSAQVFLAFFLSAVSGRVSDAGHFRLCFWTGTAFQIAGTLTTSFCSHTYWQLLLAQGVCVGLGAGILVCPVMSIVPAFFQRYKGLALGIVTCGNVTGGLVFPAMARQLLPSIGFPWTMRIIAFVEAGLLLVIGLVIRVRSHPHVSGPLLDFRAFLEAEFSLYIVGMFFNNAGLFTALYYIASFGREGVHPGLSYPASLNLLLIFNGVGCVGRLAASFTVDRVGPLNLIYPLAMASALCYFCWTAVHNRSSVYAWSTFCALPVGAMQALFPAGLNSLTTDPSKTGRRMGMGFTCISLSVLAGPPVAGAMVTAMHGRYLGAQLYAAALMVVGGSFVIMAKVVRMRKTRGGWMEKI